MVNGKPGASFTDVFEGLVGRYDNDDDVDDEDDDNADVDDDGHDDNYDDDDGEV